MKRKLSSIIVALVMALGIAFAVPTGLASAKADTTVTNGSVTVNATDFTGIALETDTDATFDLGTIDLTGVNPSEPIMEFLPWTAKRGGTYDANLTTYGTFTIEFTSGEKSLSVTSLFRGNNEFILGAKGENQARYTSFDWSQGLNNDPPNWNDSAGTTLPFRKDGSYLSRRMGLADGTTPQASAVAMTPVGIYLSLGDKATIWSDVTIDHASFAGKNGRVGFMSDDNLPAETGETPDYCRFPIRNLDVQIGNMPAWVPFTADELKTVNVKFSISGVTADTKMLVTDIYGDVLTASVYTKGLTNEAYEVPAPAVLAGAVNNFVTAGGTYKVTKGADEIVPATAWTPGVTFLPTTAGTYTVTYSVDVDPDPEKGVLTKTVDIEIADSLPDAVINLTVPTNEGATAYIRDVVNLGATVTNENQSLAQSVTLSIARNGSPIIGMQNVPVGEDYIFDTDIYPLEGEYTLTYATTDLLGRTVTKEVTTYVSRTYVTFIDGIENNMYYEKGSDVVVPALSDLELFDILDNAVVTPVTGTITVTAPNGTTTPVANANFEQEGVYEIKYSATYASVIEPGTSYVANATRNISVYSQDIPTITVAKLPTNVVAKPGVTVADDIIKVKAIVGSEITFPYGFFTGDYDIDGVELIKASTGAITDVTAGFMTGAYVFKPTAVDVYTFSAYVNHGKYRAVRSIEIDAKNAWYELQPVSDRKVTVGDTLTSLAPVIKDYYGNVVAKDSITVKVFFNYNELGGEGTIASTIGQYEIKFSFTDATKGETVSGSYFIVAVDDEKPVITLGEKKTSSLRGKFIKVAAPTITDKSGNNINPEITVLKDGKEITFYNGGFYADEKGKYEIIYSATDAAGNQQIVTYVIEVGSATTGLVVGLSVGGGVLLLLIAGAVVLIILNKKGVIDLKKIFAKKEKPAPEVIEEEEEIEEVAEETTENEEK